MGSGGHPGRGHIPPPGDGRNLPSSKTVEYPMPPFGTCVRSASGPVRIPKPIKHPMKALFKTTLCLAAGLLLTATATAEDKKVDPNGKWTWTTEGRQGGMRTNSLSLKLDGDKLTGTIAGMQRGGGGAGGGAPQETPIEEAKLKGDEISFQVTREFNGNQMVSKYTAKIAGDTLKGKWSIERNGEVMEREFEAKRVAAKKE